MKLTRIFFCILILFSASLSSCITLNTHGTIPNEVKMTEIYIETTESSDSYFVVNTNTNKFHLPDCYYTTIMNKENKYYFYGTFEEAERLGYSFCNFCEK